MQVNRINNGTKNRIRYDEANFALLFRTRFKITEKFLSEKFLKK